MATAYDSKLPYEPLTKTGIRLITFIPASTDNKVQLELHRFDIRTAPPYVALSYAWGDDKESVSIQCHGHGYYVTRNLYSALLQIQDLSNGYRTTIQHQLGLSHLDNLYLWIDAISIGKYTDVRMRPLGQVAIYRESILASQALLQYQKRLTLAPRPPDQASTNDKADQIPRMGEIYSSAFTVLVWLGEVDALLARWHPRTRDDLSLLQQQINTWVHRQSFGMPCFDLMEDLRKRLTIRDHFKSLQLYFKILELEWFERASMLMGKRRHVTPSMRITLCRYSPLQSR